MRCAPWEFAEPSAPQELERLIKRKFEQHGDLDTAYALLLKSRGLERTRLLAEEHAQKAVDALSVIPDSESKQALAHLCHLVLSRNK